MRLGVIFLPGIVTPVELAYAELAPLVVDREVLLLDLALYDGTAPRPYRFDHEISALAKAADAAALSRFHLVGFSAGASVAAVAGARMPYRVASLTLIEPPWLGNEGRSASEAAEMARIDAVLAKPPEQALAAFLQLLLRPGVAPPAPQPGPAPQWMATRPDGIRAIGEAFAAGHLPPEVLGELPMPMLFVVCGNSNPALFAAMADRAARQIPRMTRLDYPDLSHLVPPQKADPAEFAARLASHWSAAEA